MAITMLWFNFAFAGSAGWECTTKLRTLPLVCLPRGYVVDAFEVAHAVPCVTVVCV